MTSTRLITLDDAPEIARLLTANREFMAPWEPPRTDDYFTEAAQAASISAAILSAERGTGLPHVIIGDSGQVVGQITLNNIVRGPLQSCSLGYWVSAAENGHGVATAAVGGFLGVAFEDLGLHRVEAGTLVHNVRSQRVLEKNGFVRYGMAPAYLNIAGEWQDHILFQVINPSA